MSQNIKRIIACGLFLAQGLVAESQPNQKNKKNSSKTNQAQQPHQSQQQQHQKPLPPHQSQQHHNQATKQQSSSQSSTSELDTMMQNFIQAAHSIAKKEKSSSEKSSGSEKSKASQKSSESEKTSPAVEKAYQSYKKLYDYMKKNHVKTVSKSQDDQIKPALKKLFDNKSIQNMAWKVKTSKSSGSQGSSKKQQ